MTITPEPLPNTGHELNPQVLRGTDPATPGREVLVTIWPDGTGELAYRYAGGTWGAPALLEPAL